MKFAFTVTLLATAALADESVGETVVAEPEPQPAEELCVWIDDAGVEHFDECQDQGLLKFKETETGEMVLDLEIPIPGLEIKEVTQERMEGWANEQMQKEEELGRRYQDEMNSYLAAIAEPWNTFVTETDKIDDDAIAADAEATTDVLSWFRDEVYFNGQPLGELLPIQQAIDGVNDYAAQEQEVTDPEQMKLPLPQTEKTVALFKAPKTMMNLQDQCVEPEDAEVDSWCQQDGAYYMEDSGCWAVSKDFTECIPEYDCGPPCRMTRADQIEQQIQDALAEKGWQEGALETWLEDIGSSWQDLMERQQEEKIAKAQADVGATADKAKAFLDTVIQEAHAISQEENQKFMDDFQAEVEKARADVQAQTEEQLGNLQKALDGIHQELKDFAETPIEELFNDGGKYEEWQEDGGNEWAEEPKPDLVLASEVASEPETNNASYYGIGAAAFSTIAAAAYLYRKSQQVKGESDSFHRI